VGEASKVEDDTCSCAHIVLWLRTGVDVERADILFEVRQEIVHLDRPNRPVPRKAEVEALTYSRRKTRLIAGEEHVWGYMRSAEEHLREGREASEMAIAETRSGEVSP
jgi:hypothetical protein